jgi:predicted glycosyltransferase
LPTTELNALLKLAPHVIARSGYTTIMDLHQIGRRAILFPTKGQWEQEYLAKRYRG